MEAASPEAPLKQVETHGQPIDLLVSDVVMPQMNGLDLARRLQTRRPDLKTLFISGYPADIIARQGILEKGLPFLAKPFSLPNLALKVREVLDG